MLLGSVAELLFDHSLFNGHPKFLGYITSSAAPIGALGDLLAATVNPNLGAFTHNLSITTFRCVPEDLSGKIRESEEYLDMLNAEFLDQLQRGGEAFLSNHVIDGRFVPRICIVNFRTALDNVRQIPSCARRSSKCSFPVYNPFGLSCGNSLKQAFSTDIGSNPLSNPPVPAEECHEDLADPGGSWAATWRRPWAALEGEVKFSSNQDDPFE